MGLVGEMASSGYCGTNGKPDFFSSIVLAFANGFFPLAALNRSYFEAGGCRDQELACYAAGESAQSNQVCRQADNFCVRPLSLSYRINISNLTRMLRL